MTREEFIEILENSLQGQVPPQMVSSNLRYYRNYISEEMAKGRSEADVLDGLGDPRLIARTIVSAAGAGTGAEESRRENPYQQEDAEAWTAKKSLSSNSWKLILILVLVIVLVVILISGMVSLVVRILLSPVFWAIILVCLCARFFFRRR